MVYASTYVRSRALLTASTVSVLGYVGYFTGMHFVDSIGWPIALIFLGAVLIGLSSLAVKLSKNYMQDAAGK